MPILNRFVKQYKEIDNFSLNAIGIYFDSNLEANIQILNQISKTNDCCTT